MLVHIQVYNYLQILYVIFNFGYLMYLSFCQWDLNDIEVHYNIIMVSYHIVSYRIWLIVKGRHLGLQPMDVESSTIPNTAPPSEGTSELFASTPVLPLLTTAEDILSSYGAGILTTVTTEKPSETTHGQVISTVSEYSRNTVTSMMLSYDSKSDTRKWNSMSSVSTEDSASTFMVNDVTTESAPDTSTVDLIVQTTTQAWDTPTKQHSNMAYYVTDIYTQTKEKPYVSTDHSSTQDSTQHTFISKVNSSMPTYILHNNTATVESNTRGDTTHGGTGIPANTKHLYNICTMLDQRRRRWADVVHILYKWSMFAGMVDTIDMTLYIIKSPRTMKAPFDVFFIILCSIVTPHPALFVLTLLITYV